MFLLKRYSLETQQSKHRKLVGESCKLAASPYWDVSLSWYLLNLRTYAANFIQIEQKNFRKNIFWTLCILEKQAYHVVFFTI